MSKTKHITSKNCIPKHVAIVMDGNGRWAKQRGKDRFYGHIEGVKSLKHILKTAVKLSVETLTVYAFSTENWNRPKQEVDALMDLFTQTLMQEIDELHENGVKLSFIGDKTMLPKPCVESLEQAQIQTKDNGDINLVVALSYSGRWDIKQAIQNIGEKIKNNALKASEIDEKTVEQYLSTSDFLNPDLFIRTGGEHRISNFLLWELAYSELYFTDVYWPDFGEADFLKAIENYGDRERRFGKTGEQIKH